MKNILFIDDEVDFLDSYSELLESNGYKVHKAYDVSRGIEIIQSRSVDLLISDINLPRFDGLSLVKQIKQFREYKNIPVIILTGFGTKDHVHQSIELGISFFLAKPCCYSKLSSTIEEALSSVETAEQKKPASEKYNDNDFLAMTVLMSCKKPDFNDNLYDFLTGKFHKVIIEEDITKLNSVFNYNDIDVYIIEAGSGFESYNEYINNNYYSENYIGVPIIVIYDGETVSKLSYKKTSGPIDSILLRPFSFDKLLMEINRITGSEYRRKKIQSVLNLIDHKSKSLKHNEIKLIGVLRKEINRLKEEKSKILDKIKNKDKISYMNDKVNKLTQKISMVRKINLAERVKLKNAKKSAGTKIKFFISPPVKYN